MSPGSEHAMRRSDGAQAAFQRYLDGLVHSWLGTVSALGFTLVPLFLVLDFFMAPPGLLPRFVLYRGIATGVCLGIYGLLRRTQPTRWSFLYGYVIAVVVGGSITAMTVDLGGYDSRYFAGLNLVIGGVNLFLPWRPMHSAVNGLVVVAMYVVANALWGGPFEPRLLASNLFFMLSTVVIAVAMTYARLELVRKEFDARSELLDANALLDGSRRELKAARDALWGEMEVAKRIQTALLPSDQKVGSFDVAALMFPAEEVGGDYYDILALPDGRGWLAVGDVSGHGVESGLVMMMTQTAILSLVRQDPAATPATVFREVNGVICENMSRLGGNRYMTLNVIRLDDEGFTLAGKHQDVLIWRKADRRVETVTNEGCWIGLVPYVDGLAPDSFVPMAAGDLAVFFTDGITEARNDDGHMFGQERLVKALEEAAEQPLADVIRRLLEAVAFFTQEQADDMTLLVVRRS